MFIDSQTSTLQFIVDQTVQWFDNLKLPGVLGLLFAVWRWVKKKEVVVTTTLSGFQADLETIKSNHLHHIQESLEGLKAGQDETIKLMNENTKDIVAAINNSKDALVNAFLASKN